MMPKPIPYRMKGCRPSEKAETTKRQEAEYGIFGRGGIDGGCYGNIFVGLHTGRRAGLFAGYQPDGGKHNVRNGCNVVIGCSNHNHNHNRAADNDKSTVYRRALYPAARLGMEPDSGQRLERYAGRV